MAIDFIQKLDTLEGCEAGAWRAACSPLLGKESLRARRALVGALQWCACLSGSGRQSSAFPARFQEVLAGGRFRAADAPKAVYIVLKDCRDMWQRAGATLVFGLRA